jgi:large subunit ribosomal protein L10
LIGKKEIQHWKLEEVNQLVDLFKGYKNIAVIEVAHLNDKQVQEMRKILRGKAVIRMSKKNLQLLAVEKYKDITNNQKLEELANKIPGQAVLCFTDMDIFELKKIFNENEWMVAAKPDEVTPVDIWVPAGDTGLPTGQVISELNMTLRLPTRIQNDTIWIREDTRTHKVGDTVDVKEAAVLKKLGIKPIESLIRIKYAWSDGELLTEDVIYMNMEKFKQDIITAFIPAQKLAIEMGIVDKETYKPLLQQAYRESLALLFELPLYIEEMQDEYIRKAIRDASAINSVILGDTLVSKPYEPEEKVKKDEEKEDEEEEDVGIGGLFG